MSASIVRLSDYRLAAGAESYPPQVLHYDDDVYDDADGPEAPVCPPPAPQLPTDHTAEMADVLRSWGVYDWRRIMRDADPVLVAQTITTVEDGVWRGNVRNPGGLFRASMRASGFPC